jgi:hypothetical protein
MGNELEISTGINATDRVIINPSDSLADGQKVQIAKPPPPPAAKQ